MTKLSIYEKSERKEAGKIHRYSRRMYLNTKRLISVFSLTLAYLLASILYVFLYIDDIFLKGFGYDYKPLLIRLLAGYLLTLAVGLIVTGRIYRKRYDRMLEGLKRYDYDLYHLGKYLEKDEV